MLREYISRQEYIHPIFSGQRTHIAIILLDECQQSKTDRILFNALKLPCLHKNRWQQQLLNVVKASPFLYSG